MNTYDYGDSNSSTAVLAGNEEDAERDGLSGTDVSCQKKRKRWKTLLDSLILRRKRKSTKAQQVLKESVSGDRVDTDDGRHVMMVMESLYRAEKSMPTEGRNATRRSGKHTSVGGGDDDDDDDDGNGLYAEQQPNKKMKIRRFDHYNVPATVSEDDDESTIWEVQSLGSCSTNGMANGTLRPMPSDLESILSVWSVLNRVDMVALFQDTGEEEVELMLVEEDIRDIVMDKPWAFTPEDRWRILDAYADLNDPSDDDEFDVCTVASCSGVSSLSSNSSCHIPIALAFTCRSRTTPTVNPWAAAKRGDMKALEAIAATHDPSIWMTEDAFEATPLHYACRSNNRSVGPQVVLFLLEQWPTGCVPSHILQRCRETVTDHNIKRILNGDQQFIEEVRDRALISDDGVSGIRLPLLLGEGEI
mmetsp:Transcript_29318/g.48457  ORF Transcript_29318/g.48457 Transcript_29318/m.48457 type:complete len:417 (-) Transcript_29318:99-1349(-)|eukprot:CAMPEP_0119014446 /NCGR_PEP_ID=MMETSP1176-20130426/9764_1 /TAXON_ID=265551 /ORGANISM="Synedropsis recta cf, Strain CCMP1620" /LENGTH=416 /DNA_ID=CAMNT_0006967627 /DNA_START=168 /DNA_END=1418 /DNA_ORIENTATION=+